MANDKLPPDRDASFVWLMGVIAALALLFIAYLVFTRT